MDNEVIYIPEYVEQGIAKLQEAKNFLVQIEADIDSGISTINASGYNRGIPHIEKGSEVSSALTSMESTINTITSEIQKYSSGEALELKSAFIIANPDTIEKYGLRKEDIDCTLADYILKSENTTTTSTVQPKWASNYLTASAGSILYNGNDGRRVKETWCDLNPNNLVTLMKNQGIDMDFWIREDGVYMYGDYVMVAADIPHMDGSEQEAEYRKGDLVQTSLGTGIVVDYCGMAEKTRKHQTGDVGVWYDIYTAWHDNGTYEHVGYCKDGNCGDPRHGQATMILKSQNPTTIPNQSSVPLRSDNVLNGDSQTSTPVITATNSPATTFTTTPTISTQAAPTGSQTTTTVTNTNSYTNTNSNNETYVNSYSGQNSNSTFTTQATDKPVSRPSTNTYMPTTTVVESTPTVNQENTSTSNSNVSHFLKPSSTVSSTVQTPSTAPVDNPKPVVNTTSNNQTSTEQFTTPTTSTNQENVLTVQVPNPNTAPVINNVDNTGGSLSNETNLMDKVPVNNPVDSSISNTTNSIDKVPENIPSDIPISSDNTLDNVPENVSSDTSIRNDTNTIEKVPENTPSDTPVKNETNYIPLAVLGVGGAIATGVGAKIYFDKKRQKEENQEQDNYEDEEFYDDDNFEDE